MRSQHEIQTELKEGGIQLPHAPAMGMSVPEGYFESFYANLQQRIQLDDSLGEFKHVNPYSTPPGYFEHFGQQLLGHIRQQDFLDSLPVDMPYQVPGDYFESLESKVLAHVKTPGDTLRLTPSRTFLHKISIAATLLLFLGLAFKGILFPSGQHPVASAEVQLAGIPDSEISKYLLEHEVELSNCLALENVDESRLDLNMMESDVLDHALDAVNDDELLNYQL